MFCITGIAVNGVLAEAELAEGDGGFACVLAAICVAPYTVLL